MKSISAIFFQAAIVLIGLGMLFLLLLEPHLEGRNVHATTFEIYFKDPFLAYVYVGSIPFFVGLYRAFGLFGQVRQSGTYSHGTVDALRGIKRCAIAVIGFVAGAAVIIVLTGDGEDRPAGVFMCLLAAFPSGVVAGTAAMLARKLNVSLARSEGTQG